jgi:hypothetical protein
MGDYGASLFAKLSSGAISIGKDLKGGDGLQTGFIEPSNGVHAPITVGGSIIGGGGSYSGAIKVDYSSLGSLVVKGDLAGGAGPNSGFVYALLPIDSLTIDGHLTGGLGQDSGAIYSAYDLVHVSVKGGVASGAGPFSGSIQSGKTIGTLSIGGDVTGTAGSNVEIIAQQSIQSVSIHGKVSHTQILAGDKASDTNSTLAEYSPQATIGSISIGGDFEASTIAAGASAGPNGFFGDGDDHLIANPPQSISRIASIIIGGSALGTADPGDHFGIVAANIGSVKIGKTLEPLTPALDLPIELVPTTTNDVTIREL